MVPGDLRNLVAERDQHREALILRKAGEWHEDYGPGLWWPSEARAFSESASYIGGHLDTDAPEWIYDDSAVWLPHPQPITPTIDA
jgi:hypothetical protein